MSGWREFWNRPNRIYVNERHLAVHYARVADDILGLAPGGGAVLLDYGCGEALEAGRVSAAVGRLHLYDAAPETRARLRARHGANPGISVLDEAGLDRLPAGAIDLILVNSVIQYLSREELEALLGRCRAWLAPGGRLVVADVIPPGGSAAADALSLLRTARRHGFLGAALAGLAATLFSDYRRMRQSLGLSTYTPEAFAGLAAQAGFAAAREPRNFGFNPRRMTFTLRPRAGAA